LIAAALLALGFGVGLYASDQVLSEDPPPTTTPAPAAGPAAEPAPPAAAPAAGGAAVDGPEETVEESRAAFSVARLPRSYRAQLKARGFWHRGCPVPLSGLRVLTITYRGFDRQVHSGQLVVNSSAAHPLKRVFRRLYQLRFPIRHVSFADFYGPRRDRPREGDVTASFECRQAVPSPCSGGLRAGHWSNHAYGLAVDLNPTENPYIGCGQSRDPATRPYRDRSRHRRGMVGPRVIAAFRSIGWGWGGSWTGNTKDYMHFSVTGH
jgi:hypothetical protein